MTLMMKGGEETEMRTTGVEFECVKEKTAVRHGGIERSMETGSFVCVGVCNNEQQKAFSFNKSHWKKDREKERTEKMSEETVRKRKNIISQGCRVVFMMAFIKLESAQEGRIVVPLGNERHSWEGHAGFHLSFQFVFLTCNHK